MLRHRPPGLRRIAMTHAVLLLLHVLAAAIWVGGMAVMLFAVRPAAVATLEVPARLAFLAAVMGRFFVAVLVAIVLLFASGSGLVVQADGWRGLHWSVQAMLALAVVMTLVFVAIRVGPFAALRRALAAGELKAGAASLATLRSLIAVNLGLGTLVYALALLGRAL
jgi:uncharacterized membrane protein